MTFVHPFNDLAVATGQGTIAMEIIKELPTVDYILVPIGGGGLMHRCFYSGQAVKSKDQGDRCGASRRQLYAGILKSRTGSGSSNCEHHCGRYCG